MSQKPEPQSAQREDTAELMTDSVALARLIEEVRNNRVSSPAAYNRMHNRHNR